MFKSNSATTDRHIFVLMWTVRGDIFPQLQNIPSLWPGPTWYYNELIIYGSMHIAGLGQKNIHEFC